MPIIKTRHNWAAFFCRVIIAIVFIPHGLDKLVLFEPFGWRGPTEWATTVATLIDSHFADVPDNYKLLIAQISAWAEVVAGASCVLGLLVRICVTPLLADMAIAILFVHWPNGYWSNHTINHVPAPGFEYNIVLMLVCLALMASGAGSLSLDGLISGGTREEYIEHPDDLYHDYET